MKSSELLREQKEKPVKLEENPEATFYVTDLVLGGESVPTGSQPVTFHLEQHI